MTGRTIHARLAGETGYRLRGCGQGQPAEQGTEQQVETGKTMSGIRRELHGGVSRVEDDSHP